MNEDYEYTKRMDFSHLVLPLFHKIHDQELQEAQHTEEHHLRLLKTIYVEQNFNYEKSKPQNRVAPRKVLASPAQIPTASTC